MKNYGVKVCNKISLPAIKKSMKHPYNGGKHSGIAALFSSTLKEKMKMIRHGRSVGITSSFDTCLAAMPMVIIQPNSMEDYLLMIHHLPTATEGLHQIIAT